MGGLYAISRKPAHGIRVNSGFPALIDAPRLRGLNAFCLPFLAKVSFELGEDSQHIKKRLTRRGAGIGRLFGRFEGDAPALHLADDVLQILHRPG